MEINFECKKCNKEFDCDVGKISLSENAMRPTFERTIICPRCGERSMDEVLLTELGQSQLTEGTFDL
jgi:transcription elongation factor Elf1